MSSLCGRLSLIGATIALGAATRAPAAEPPEAVTKILAAVGQPNAAALRAARTEFAKSGENARAEVRTTYAMTLALLQNGRHAEAAKTLDALAKSQQRSAAIRRARLFLAVQLDQDERASELLTSLVDSAIDKDAKGAETERPDTVRLLAGLLTLAKARAGEEQPPEEFTAAADKLAASLSPELLDVFEQESARVAKLLHDRRAQAQRADAAADERAEQELQALTDQVEQMQQQVDEADAAFHKDQPTAIAQVRKGRKEVKALEKQLGSLVAASNARGERAPREPQPTVDGKGQIVRYPSTTDILQYQRDVERWQVQERARIQKNAAALAATRERLATERDAVEKLQQDLAAGGDDLDLQKKELKKLKSKLSILKQRRRADADAFRPADFAILPLAVEKDRILKSYQR